MEGTDGIAPVASPVPPVVAPMASDAGMDDGSVFLAAIPDATTVAAVVEEPTGPVGAGGSEPVKRKRGRPRKYAPDGSLAKPLSASPASAGVPGEYRSASAKRGRGRPMNHFKRPRQGVEMSSFGEMIACSSGANFTPHIITVAAGEDITMKIISFSQEGPGAVCVLSANGFVSNVSLRRPDSFGGTSTYEGPFELLSLSGSFVLTENDGTRIRSGGLSVSLVSPDGHVLGGGVGHLIAASPVKVMLGSFIPSYQMEQKEKKSKSETISYQMEQKKKKSKSEPISISFQTNMDVSTIPNVTDASVFHQEAWTAIPSTISDGINSLEDIRITEI